MEAIILLVSLVLTRGPSAILSLQKLFNGNAFTEEDLKKLAAGVKDPESYFNTPLKG